MIRAVLPLLNRGLMLFQPGYWLGSCRSLWGFGFVEGMVVVNLRAILVPTSGRIDRNMA